MKKNKLWQLHIMCNIYCPIAFGKWCCCVHFSQLKGFPNIMNIAGVTVGANLNRVLWLVYIGTTFFIKTHLIAVLIVLIKMK